MDYVNRARGLTRKSPGPFYQRLWNGVGTYAGKACSALLSIPDWLRMLFRHREEMLAAAREQQQTDIIHLRTQLDKGILPWTIDVAFYAISGAVILEDDYENDLTMSDVDIGHLADYDAASLIPLQRAALQKPGKASVLAKMITCTQALWFCSQCIARLSQNMAISLIELNTFAHCISAFFIYAFWWHKPYDAEAHIYIDHPQMLQEHLFLEAAKRTCETGFWGKFTLTERTDDGQVSTLATSLRFKGFEPRRTGTKNMPITIKRGAAIPGTGFTLLDPSEPDGHSLRLSYRALDYWKRAWRLRCNTTLRSHSNYEFKYHYQTPEESCGIRRRAKNMDREFDNSAFGDKGIKVPLILTSVFLVYGGVHLLAWQYNFQTDAEGITWRVASTITASSGLIIPLVQTASYLADFGLSSPWLLRLNSRFALGLVYFAIFLMGVEILARSFLVIESFRALPNSPSSVYEIPMWTAYLPHV